MIALATVCLAVSAPMNRYLVLGLSPLLPWLR